MFDAGTSVAELMSLRGKAAVVTGAAMGIGLSIATRLAEVGARVVIADIDGDAADIAAKDLRARDLEVAAVWVDVSDESSVVRLMSESTRLFGSIDILVNNAGIFPSVPVLDMQATDFDRVIAVNLRGVYLCCRHAATQMLAQGHGGRIINITSIDAVHPSMVGLAHYDASKHGVWGFTKNLARELAPHQVWVNAIAPGGIITPGVQRMQEGFASPDVDVAAVLAGFEAAVPMGRMGDPDEIARVVLFLASDLSTYMTGSQLVVDGGVLLT